MAQPSWLGVHSHLIHGKDGNLPSIIDIAHQERLERAGYKTIGIILNYDFNDEDLFVRIFTNRLKYKIKIFGERYNGS